MNKLKKNATVIKQFLFVFLFAVLLITSLSVYILSIEVYEGGFDANMDYLVFMIISIILLINSIYAIVKSNKDQRMPRIITLALCSSIGGLYSLGVFFKALTKTFANGKEFIYTSYQLYLYTGIVCLTLALIAFFEYLETKKD